METCFCNFYCKGQLKFKLKNEVKEIVNIEINSSETRVYQYGCESIMKKSSYGILFITCFVFFLILNSFFVIVPADLSTIIGVIVGTLIESLIVYLIILLIAHIVNHYSRLF
jgi:hypothetical protein